MLLQQGKNITISRGAPCEMKAGIYALEYNAQSGSYLLVEQPSFAMPKKIYEEKEMAMLTKKWLAAFERAHKNLGILLVGLRGSGKSMMAQYVCLNAGRPVILITEQVLDTTAFFEFMSSPELRGSIIFIDEFEKVFGNLNNDNRFDGANEGALLPLMQLMDGNYQTRFLFLLTSNGKIHSSFENRLGRIRYRVSYDALHPDLVVAYLEDNLIDKRKKQIDKIMQIIDKLGFVTYDLLTHFVDELNHTTADPVVVLLGLNVAPVYHYYTVKFRKSGTKDKWYSAKARNMSIHFGSYTLQVDTYSMPDSAADNLPDEIAEVDEVINMRDYEGLTMNGGTIVHNGWEVVFRRALEDSLINAFGPMTKKGIVFQRGYEDKV